MSATEILDVVDEHDRVIGQAPRAEVHARRLRHRAVHILLFNMRGELYLQKRAATKDSFPGCYDSSASGHLEAGEAYDAGAVRELREELGLTGLPLQRLFKITAGAETGQEFVWVYRAAGDYQPAPNPVEIESGRFWPLAELRTMLAAKPARFASSFIKVFDLYERFR
jgi:isopentenyl-diphosphate delta-isomerase type 1